MIITKRKKRTIMLIIFIAIFSLCLSLSPSLSLPISLSLSFSFFSISFFYPGFWRSGHGFMCGSSVGDGSQRGRRGRYHICWEWHTESVLTGDFIDVLILSLIRLLRDRWEEMCFTNHLYYFPFDLCLISNYLS